MNFTRSAPGVWELGRRKTMLGAFLFSRLRCMRSVDFVEKKAVRNTSACNQTVMVMMMLMMMMMMIVYVEQVDKDLEPQVPASASRRNAGQLGILCCPTSLAASTGLPAAWEALAARFDE